VQARVLDWQVRTAFAGGCAGAFVYAWTDEWYRAAADLEDWDFGLTRRDRAPTAALATVRQAAAEAPVAPGAHAPSISECPGPDARRGGPPDPRSTGRRTARRVRRPRAGQARAGAADRPRGGARPRVQFRVPQEVPGSSLGLRSTIPHRRRRRGHMLAATTAG